MHRDLKPANVGITRSGTVKLLDFGLAKRSRIGPGSGVQATADSRPSSLPTIAATIDGMVLGTVAYMSRTGARSVGRQTRRHLGVRLRAVRNARRRGGIRRDHGRRRCRHPGSQPEAIVAAVSPRECRRRCSEHFRKTTSAASRYRRRAHRSRRPGTRLSTASRHESVRAVEFGRLTDRVGMNEWPAISPDGKMVAYVAAADGRQQIWIQLLAGGTAASADQGRCRALATSMGTRFEHRHLPHRVGLAW